MPGPQVLVAGINRTKRLSDSLGRFALRASLRSGTVKANVGSVLLTANKPDVYTDLGSRFHGPDAYSSYHCQSCEATAHSARLKFLVDTGAFYSVVPAAVLRRLGIKPGRTKSFIFADGTEIKRSLGQALFRVNGEEGASPVMFGQQGDSVLLGSVSLEALGFFLEPLKRELRPLPRLLASERAERARL